MCEPPTPALFLFVPGLPQTTVPFNSLGNPLAYLICTPHQVLLRLDHPPNKLEPVQDGLLPAALWELCDHQKYYVLLLPHLFVFAQHPHRPEHRWPGHGLRAHRITFLKDANCLSL